MQRLVKSETTTPLRTTTFTLIQRGFAKTQDSKRESNSKLNLQSRLNVADIPTVAGRGVLH